MEIGGNGREMGWFRGSYWAGSVGSGSFCPPLHSPDPLTREKAGERRKKRSGRQVILSAIDAPLTRR